MGGSGRSRPFSLRCVRAKQQILPMLQALHCRDRGKDYAAVILRGFQLMLLFLRRVAGDQRAVTAIEYALIICLISTAGIGAMTTLGHTLFNQSAPVAAALP
jgi:Flp pilus assembly pilin Flp